MPDPTGTQGLPSAWPTTIEWTENPTLAAEFRNAKNSFNSALPDHGPFVLYLDGDRVGFVAVSAQAGSYESLGDDAQTEGGVTPIDTGVSQSYDPQN